MMMIKHLSEELTGVQIDLNVCVDISLRKLHRAVVIYTHNRNTDERKHTHVNLLKNITSHSSHLQQSNAILILIESMNVFTQSLLLLLTGAHCILQLTAAQLLTTC